LKKEENKPEKIDICDRIRKGPPPDNRNSKNAKNKNLN
jgi:hypothetical protein